MIGVDLARAFDPVLLARDCGIAPDEWQARLLRERPRRALLCCCRQAGKTVVTVLLALWVALYEAPALVLILSPSLRQSGEVFRTLMGFYAKLKSVPELRQESVLRCELANGSRIISLPGTERTVRGYSKADLIVIDEAARVEDELLAATRPMMAVSEGGGRLIALSTPAGKRGWFYEAWTGSSADWHRVRVPASECPRITQAFLVEELRELGAQRFSEEYGLEFLDPDEAVFPSAIIDAAFTAEVLPLWN
jgi:hypothetical protein